MSVTFSEGGQARRLESLSDAFGEVLIAYLDFKHIKDRNLWIFWLPPHFMAVHGDTQSSVNGIISNRLL
jgi:hypothetical protein